MIIDCKKIKDEILEEVKSKVAELPFVPLFCDILVGDDAVSRQYVNIKARTAKSVGVKFRTAEFPETITTEELVQEIENLNRVPHMCGIIVQLPLPSHINADAVLDTIAPELDVDCLGVTASTKFYNDESVMAYPTALACLKILDSLHIDFSGKKFVVLGQGHLVGKPVTHLLRARGFEVQTVTKDTADSLEIIKNADVIVSGMGHGRYITGKMIKKDAIIIDAGSSEEGAGIVGDVDIDSVLPVASYVSPTPGGVGPVTVAMLLSNVLSVAEQKNHDSR